MSIVVLGVNHKSAPIDVIERVAITGEAMTKALHGIVTRDNVRETVVLSTCNRTEVYVVAEKFHGAFADVRDFFVSSRDCQSMNCCRIFTVSMTMQP